MTWTVGMAWSSVHCAVVWLFHSRQPIPKTAIATAAIRAILPNRFSPGGVVWRNKCSEARLDSGVGPVSIGPASGFLSGISLSGLGAPGRGPGGVAAVNDAEYHRHE